MKKKRLYFVANQAKTWFFIALANRLADEFDVGFITTNKGWKKYLERQRFNVVFLGINPGPVIDQPLDCSELERYRHLCSVDRFLMSKPKHYQTKILVNLLRQLSAHKDELAGAIILGEMTWASEIVLWDRQKRLDYQYFNMHPIRFPADRFAFFCDPAERNVVKINQRLKKDGLSTLSEPDVFWKNLRAGGIMSKMKVAFEPDVFDPADPSGRFYPRMLVTAIKRKLSRPRLNFSSEVPRGPALYIVLHMEPERSVNGFLPEHKSQKDFASEVVKGYSRGHQTVLCIHPRQAFLPMPKWISSWVEENNALLFNGFPRDKIHPNSTVASISGTVLLELLGKACSLICAVPFFITYGTEVKPLYSRPYLIENAEVDSHEEVIHNSYRGVIADPYFVPSVMLPSNINSVAMSINHCFKSIS